MTELILIDAMPRTKKKSRWLCRINICKKTVRVRTTREYIDRETHEILWQTGTLMHCPHCWAAGEFFPLTKAEMVR